MILFYLIINFSYLKNMLNHNVESIINNYIYKI